MRRISIDVDDDVFERFHSMIPHGMKGRVARAAFDLIDEGLRTDREKFLVALFQNRLGMGGLLRATTGSEGELAGATVLPEADGAIPNQKPSDAPAAGNSVASPKRNADREESSKGPGQRQRGGSRKAAKGPGGDVR